MDLLSALKRSKPAAPDATDGVRLARTRARRRLIGAAVLVIAGIVGFPLLFETQPRPIPVDLPIDIPRKDGAPALAMPQAPAATSASEPARPTDPIASANRMIEETPADAGRELAPKVQAASAPAAGAATAGAARTAPVAASGDKAKSASAVAPASRDRTAASEDGARAKALLEGKNAAAPEASPPAAGAPRYVVQVGAFADAAAVKATRAKVERLGLSTYTQVAETAAGARTRVRVGPFATRAEAERAAAQIKGADLPTVILTL